ncbi:selenocysteine-specific translation elongation factor [Rodentibacter pneumotropicus]|uniref:selenocysteine-specific translation elongation factor n=1 Tax=Rodentibacter pneumotropicus TaxID=758 RepID=UPI0003772485|nr:selenocysteine-specific translation elongation factor [Rodentibacter pneumotropicus]NBH76409.1 selenocysteine-specific translation elongation factor [Rodentibacter pneumotropicus]OOF63343.1 selenocysteine-specific translation elongation factor [Rodentibacter pneumotropicus]THA01218.1 selenocysteine-specific translation elongation factor [Rodentibacter pneumotropicus]THA04887.1 selenocysteine-specific translation elongation factor [Rodentibacter pneumotropicus]THA12633.1 selenocysteine-speci
MIIVTSGHVDHGKTALLKTLTGVNTTHLPEEKKRGMTIDLGYAYLPLGEGGKTLGFIDVPGHEKFLSNMLAGLGGVHYAMLIIAADEGIAAQTKEHLAILRQLQFHEIILVITKADRVDSVQIDTLIRQIKQDYPFLCQAKYFITSAENGQGIEELRDYLQQLPELAETQKPFRYAIDRVFSVKGAGTVVTGTAFAGTVQVEDELYLSKGQKVRVKAIHAQNTPSELGLAGQRLALNLNVDLDRIPIKRGDWLLQDVPPSPTTRVSVQIWAETSLNESQPVHIYHAATRTTGKLSLLQSKNVAKNDRTLAEIILDSPLFLAFGDKLILRSGDAKALVAGAWVLEINSPKRHKRTEVRLNFLANLALTENEAERIALTLKHTAVAANQLMWGEQISDSQLDEALAQRGAMRYQDWCFNADYQAEKTQQILTALATYHKQNDDQLGVSKARLYRMAALNQPENLIYHLIDEMLENGKLQQTRGWLHLPEHKIRFNEEEQTRWQWVLKEFEKANGQAIWVRDMANVLGTDESEMRNFMYKAGKLGYLTPIVKDRFFLTETIYAYARLIKQIAEEEGKASVNGVRDRLNFGRKLTVQLMEYFDRIGFLRRKGNEHILRDKNIFDL